MVSLLELSNILLSPLLNGEGRLTKRSCFVFLSHESVRKSHTVNKSLSVFSTNAEGRIRHRHHYLLSESVSTIQSAFSAFWCTDDVVKCIESEDEIPLSTSKSKIAFGAVRRTNDITSSWATIVD